VQQQTQRKSVCGPGRTAGSAGMVQAGRQVRYGETAERQVCGRQRIRTSRTAGRQAERSRQNEAAGAAGIRQKSRQRSSNEQAGRARTGRWHGGAENGTQESNSKMVDRTHAEPVTQNTHGR